MSKLLYPQVAGAAIANRAFRALCGKTGPAPRRDLAAGTLVQVLQHRAQQQGDKTAFTFLLDAFGDEASVTYAELDLQARSVAAKLEEFAALGDRAVLLFPPGLEFIAAYFGCLYAGVAAVPAYPPHPGRPDKALPKLRAIFESARPAAVLTTATLRDALAPLLSATPGSHVPSFIALESIGAAPRHEPRGLETDENSLAMVQFTSGSTGTPRGVMVTHGNLMHNLGLIQQAYGASRESRGVFWLPFYHDMGLIGGVLETIYCGGSSTFLSPLSFVQQPLRWLEAISRTRATISGGPNFAYEECVRRIDDEQLAGLDLSQWRMAFCGAEPIHRETLDEFAKKFARCGFRKDALYCCYGMAEATLLISGGRFASSGGKHGAAAGPVSCGKPVGDVNVKIVHPETSRVCKAGEVGEIWVESLSRGQGYWGRPDDTQETFQARLSDGSGPYLRTGDLGFLRGGEVFVTGRLKDMIIVGGANHYPQDIERTVLECHPLLAGNGAAAFGIEADRHEGLAVVVEVSRQFHRVWNEYLAGGESPLATEIKTAIRQAIAQRHEIAVDAIALVQPRTIPRTSSGKIQRRACRQAYLDETLSRVDRS